VQLGLRSRVRNLLDQLHPEVADDSPVALGQPRRSTRVAPQARAHPVGTPGRECLRRFRRGPLLVTEHVSELGECVGVSRKSAANLDRWPGRGWGHRDGLCHEVTQSTITRPEPTATVSPSAALKARMTDFAQRRARRNARALRQSA
jgi:hypothetical protein